jgi:hypothetical protein
MVNTRSTGAGSGQQGQNNQGTDQPLPMPPPLTPEQFFQLQIADDGHSEQHCSDSAADPRPATTSSTAVAPQQARGLSEGSPADVLPCG